MSLQSRKQLFSDMCSRFDHEKVSDLISVVTLSDDSMCNLLRRLDLYLSVSPAAVRTPNGLLVPKRTSSLEFNLLAQTFYRVMAKLDIADYVTCWNVPLNVRIKDKWNARGERSTTHKHADAWVGENPRSVTVMLFLSGCSRENCVRFYDPPEAFDEAWLSPRSYEEGQTIAERYKPLDYLPLNGHLVLADFATIHNSYRSPFAMSTRLGIDTTFGLHAIGEDFSAWQWRGQRLAGFELGRSHLFTFPDAIDDRVDCVGGSKQAVNCEVKTL